MSINLIMKFLFIQRVEGIARDARLSRNEVVHTGIGQRDRLAGAEPSSGRGHTDDQGTEGHYDIANVHTIYVCVKGWERRASKLDVMRLYLMEGALPHMFPESHERLLDALILRYRRRCI